MQMWLPWRRVSSDMKWNVFPSNVRSFSKGKRIDLKNYKPDRRWSRLWAMSIMVKPCSWTPSVRRMWWKEKPVESPNISAPTMSSLNMGMKGGDLIKKLMDIGVMVTINQMIDADVVV